MHRDVAVAAARVGKHIWVEKPAGRNPADTTAIAEAVLAAGVQSAVGFNCRNAPAVQLAREMCRLGSDPVRSRPCSVRLLSDYAAHPDGALSSQFAPAYAGTGVLSDLASHTGDWTWCVTSSGERTGEIAELVADQATYINSDPRPPAPVSHFATAAGGAPRASRQRGPDLPCCASQVGARGCLESSRVAVGEAVPVRVRGRGDRGAVSQDFRRMGELQVCVDQGYQNAAWRSLRRTRDRRPGCLPARRGNRHGLRRPEGHQAERAWCARSPKGKPVGATIDRRRGVDRTAGRGDGHLDRSRAMGHAMNRIGVGVIGAGDAAGREQFLQLRALCHLPVGRGSDRHLPDRLRGPKGWYPTWDAPGPRTPCASAASRMRSGWPTPPGFAPSGTAGLGSIRAGARSRHRHDVDHVARRPSQYAALGVSFDLEGKDL